MTPAEAKKLIRKAIEAHLETALIAANFYIPGTSPAELAVQFGNLSFDRNRLLELFRAANRPAEYVRVTNHFADVRVIEMGSTPRIEANGFTKFGIFTQAGSGEDRNDTIAGIIGAAYAYNTELSRGAIDVTIGRQKPGDTVIEDEAWLYSPLTVHWDVWRTT